MKYVSVLLCAMMLSFLKPVKVSAQSYEVQQLLLDVEKLSQLKKILQDMYKGYEIINSGYNAVKDISKGNFDLHKDFLDKLFQVSPAVQKYKKVTDIISYQLRIVKEYKAAFNRFKQDKNFTLSEVEYMGKVYSNLFRKSVESLDELTMIVTPGQLRMSDDERLQAIDRIYSEIESQYLFLKDFNNSTTILSLQRTKEQIDVDVSRKLREVN